MSTTRFLKSGRALSGADAGLKDISWVEALPEGLRKRKILLYRDDFGQQSLYFQSKSLLTSNANPWV